MATPAKKIQNKHHLEQVDDQADATGSSSRISLTPARRRELIREMVEEYRETLDILARYDREHAAEDPTN